MTDLDRVYRATTEPEFQSRSADEATPVVRIIGRATFGYVEGKIGS
jgi:hypothetical protein